MHPIDVLLKRRSIRKFKKKVVPWDNVVSMISCALNIPLAGNVHNMKFITIQDPTNLEVLAQHCHNQDFIAKAPLAIVIVGEPEHLHSHYGVRGEKLYTIQHCAAAAMNIINAAEALGLGSCWVGAFDEDALRADLGMPEYVNVHVVLAIGFPDESPKKPVRPWIRSTVYLEKWWSGSKHPSLGFYSLNTQKAIKNSGDAIKKVAEKILGRKK